MQTLLGHKPRTKKLTDGVIHRFTGQIETEPRAMAWSESYRDDGVVVLSEVA